MTELTAAQSALAQGAVLAQRDAWSAASDAEKLRADLIRADESIAQLDTRRDEFLQAARDLGADEGALRKALEAGGVYPS